MQPWDPGAINNRCLRYMSPVVVPAGPGPACALRGPWACEP